MTPSFPADSPPWTRGDGSFRYLDTRPEGFRETPTVRAVSVHPDRVVITSWQQHRPNCCQHSGNWMEMEEMRVVFDRETAGLLVRTLSSLGVY